MTGCAVTLTCVLLMCWNESALHRCVTRPATPTAHQHWFKVLTLPRLTRGAVQLYNGAHSRPTTRNRASHHARRLAHAARLGGTEWYSGRETW